MTGCSQENTVSEEETSETVISEAVASEIEQVIQKETELSGELTGIIDGVGYKCTSNPDFGNYVFLIGHFYDEESNLVVAQSIEQDNMIKIEHYKRDSFTRTDYRFAASDASNVNKSEFQLREFVHPVFNKSYEKFIAELQFVHLAYCNKRWEEWAIDESMLKP